MSGNIQSIQRAIAVLEYITFHAGAGISELSRELNLNKSTVFGIVKTLEGLGYLFKNEPTDSYQVTYRLQTLAEVSADANSVISYARPYLQQLNDTYDETIHFVRAMDDTVVYLDKLESNKSIRIHSDVGGQMPLHCTAVGKAILAWRGEQGTAEYAARTGLPPMTAHSIEDADGLREEMRRVRAQGFSIDDEENQDGLYCIGVPIFDKAGSAHHAISISMPKYRKDEIDLAKAVEDLREAAKGIAAFF